MTLSPEEAQAQARARMRGLIREAASEGQLVGKIVREETRGSCCRVEAVVYVTKDIARTAEFPLPDLPAALP